jgi:hypothetical protein
MSGIGCKPPFLRDEGKKARAAKDYSQGIHGTQEEMHKNADKWLFFFTWCVNNRMK